MSEAAQGLADGGGSGPGGVGYSGFNQLLTDAEKQVCYESNRILMALRAQGINPDTLTSMERADVIRALAFDSQLFEDFTDGSPALTRYWRSYALRDAQTLDASEREAAIAEFQALTPAEREHMVAELANAASLFFSIGLLPEQEATPEAAAVEVALYRSATPDYPAMVQVSYAASRPVTLESKIEKRLGSALDDIMTSLRERFGEIEVADFDGGRMVSPADAKGVSWTTKIKTEQQAQAVEELAFGTLSSN